MSVTRIIAPLLLLSVTGCGGDGGDPVTVTPAPSPTPAPTPAPTPTPTPTPAASVRREISPTTVDGQVTTFTSPYIVINPGGVAKGRLLVMLPGTGATPQAYQAILAEAVAQGYHAIGLSYPNDRSVFDVCMNSGDADCAGNVRGETITGTDMTTAITVDARNSIVGRLTELLGYLARTAPDEGWAGFLVNGQPDWSRITIAGHSQGAGHAGYMAKLYALNRVAMFSGPADVGPNGQANWLRMPNVTPTSQMFGFIHDDDQTVPPALAKQEWATLGLQGPPTEVDGLTTYAGPSHQLTTSVPPRNGSAHSSTVADRFTPLTASGTPQFASIWDYMAFP